MGDKSGLDASPCQFGEERGPSLGEDLLMITWYFLDKEIMKSRLFNFDRVFHLLTRLVCCFLLLFFCRHDRVQTCGGRCWRCGEERSHHPADPEPLRGRIWSHHRGEKPTVSLGSCICSKMSCVSRGILRLMVARYLKATAVWSVMLELWLDCKDGHVKRV